MSDIKAPIPVVFIHGLWMHSSSWDNWVRLFAANGYTALAPGWPGDSASTEVTRYLGQHGSARVAKAVLLGAVPPLMLRTEANPQGQPIEAFDAIRAGVSADRSQFYRYLSAPFYGANRAGAEVSQGARDAFWLMSMQVSLKGALDCVQAFSETDFTQDLRSIDVPVLIAHGDDDQIVPINASAHQSSQLVKDAVLKVYPGSPHGLVGGFKKAFHADLLAFITG
ncbi:alpha/beta fold hydrolase [Streptomyces sp. H27-D2]|uniref:alpha/beta fold hydrolase n=1 Tax=Streptomyces sp. H27-D2 TaxID=3046304 RepID=UPI002DBB293E|nr:alpha/beta hydrolase [Streptomyces sp. H27-D2]MEC4020740.1 alpha/beta hydrolase [Streptomyces sp. H27-D2]